MAFIILIKNILHSLVDEQNMYVVLKRGAHQTEGRGEKGGRTVISRIKADVGATA
jgi:hypothetical protein